jgi:mRNA interferase HigB
MRIIARSALNDFSEKNPKAKASLDHWYSIAKAAKWENTGDIQAAFANAKVLNGERVRFEIAGGKFRLIVAFSFDPAIAFVKFVGTHAEYDKIDALTVSVFRGA